MTLEAVTGLGSLIEFLIQNYGLTGAAIAALLWLMYRNNKKSDKRITDLEKQVDEDKVQQIANYKEMISEYVDLVKTNTEVVSKLTPCINAFHEALNRVLAHLPPKKDGDKE